MKQKILKIGLASPRRNNYSLNALGIALKNHFGQNCWVESPKSSFPPPHAFLHIHQLFPGQSMFTNQWQAFIGKGDKHLVAWSAYSSESELIYQELQSARYLQGNRDILHILGGVHASARPQEVLDKGFDFAFCGEGEIAIIQMANALLEEKSFPEIPGLRWAGNYGGFK